MIGECDYYMKPKLAPWRCNDCPDYVKCAYDSGVVRSHNETDERQPYPWNPPLSVRTSNQKAIKHE